MAVKILTHGDADGICAAALAMASFPEAEVWFTRPIALLRDLNEVEPGTMVIICDVAISETHKGELFQRMRELAQRDEVIYIDHHPLPPDTLKRDIPATQFVHEIGTSASELAFRFFIQDPKSDLDRVALWGAIADYCEETGFVRDGLSKYDRRTIYMEAGLLTQALGEAAGDYHYKRDVLLRLSQGTPPTEIPEIVDRAVKATKREWEVYEYVKKHVVLEGNIAIVHDLPSGSLGKAALYALGLTGTDVGICTRRDGEEVDVSMRRRAGAKIDLNEMLRHITARLGGSGGGHEGAAGATIPASIFDAFLETIKKEVSPVISREPGLKR
ncbi:MAG: DHHA1 domain-containing protein [Hadesarchaea archaeon]|nr:DHHA1 domain-containing protein [Hadesarchaea archaeon]